MIKVAIYGNGKWSRQMGELLNKEYSDILEANGGERIEVISYVVDTPSKYVPETMKQILVEDFLKEYHQKALEAIVIPKEYYMQYNDLIQTLVRGQVNVNDIYNGIRLHDHIRSNEMELQQLITPMLQDSYLSYLEFHVADHCNLNCKYCTHYSPLVNTPVFTNFEKFKKDLVQLKKYIDDLGIVRILGGEPLLNPELPEFIEYTREIYPKAIITVVTNGLLLDRISDDLIYTMKKTLSFFHISFYKPLVGKSDEIAMRLLQMKIPFTMSSYNEKFNKTQTLVPQDDEDFFYECFQATCTCIHDGKLAPCYAPFTTKYFNEAFNQQLPTDEGIDLYDEKNTTEDMKLQLLFPLERCKYCIKGNAYPWEVIGKNSRLEDWV